MDSSPNPWWRTFFESPDSFVLSYFPEPHVTHNQVEAIIGLLELKPGQRVADICCGHCRHTLPLQQAGLSMIGLDVSGMMLHVASELAREQGMTPCLVQGFAQMLPFADGAFDAALNLFNSMGYMDDEQNRAMLEEIARCLKPGGRFLLDCRIGQNGIEAKAFDVGIATIDEAGRVLDTWYPDVHLDATGGVQRFGDDVGHEGGSQTYELDRGHTFQSLKVDLSFLIGPDERRKVDRKAVVTFIEDLAEPPVDAHDAYLRLHLLSHRIVTPHSIQMADVFDELNIVAWTNKGPCQPDNFEALRTNLRMRGLIHVYSIDRMPRMVDYVVPSGVRIAEAERVRLGAYLAPGTTVLREGFVSLNSG